MNAPHGATRYFDAATPVFWSMVGNVRRIGAQLRSGVAKRRDVECHGPKPGCLACELESKTQRGHE